MNNFVSVILTIIVAVVFGLAIGYSFYGPTANALIEECEASLPRTQHCILTAIPENYEQTN